MNPKGNIKFFLNRTFLNNCMAIGGAGAGFNTINSFAPYATEVWLSVSVAV